MHIIIWSFIGKYFSICFFTKEHFKLCITTLKLIAMFFMLVDHIAEFIPNIPIQFHWIGRLSAPIFFFCLIEGYKNTSSKKNYFMRLYFFGIIVGLIRDSVFFYLLKKFMLHLIII